MPEQDATKTEEATDSQPENFEVWLSAQPENVQKLYNEHVSGLQNTVKATRKERDDLKDQIKETLKQVEKGSEAEKALQENLTKLEYAERKANFLEDAIRPEIGCKNPRVAFALAMAEDLFLKDGRPDWSALKQSAPELFGTNNVKSNAGKGTDNPPKNEDMNTIIRRVAGVQ